MGNKKITLCVESSYIEETGKTSKLDLSSIRASSETLIKFLGDLTIAERLKYSPEAKDILEKCGVRGAPFSNLKTMNRKECSEYYELSKFVTNQLTCYRIKPTDKPLSEVLENSISFDPEHPGVESTFTFNDTIFKNVQEFKLFIIPEAYNPLEELMRPQTFNRGYNMTQNHLGFRYRMVSHMFYCSSFCPFLNFLNLLKFK